MKVRIRFSKHGALVYIGHLDVMRYFQKLFRRADIPVKYSEGFSPHQILSFTPPLPLGMESFGEYADVELTQSVPTKKALAVLRKKSVPEIEIMSFRQLPDGCENAMASVKAASYSFIYDDKAQNDAVKDAVTAFLDKSELNILKKTKKNERIINIRPLVYDLTVDTDAAKIDMTISSGSLDNIKPELVLDCLIQNCGLDSTILTGSRTVRLDQFTDAGGKLISLDEAGEDII
ncbi:MAG: TIGR03936 family radical SAM-associated protein [Lachnospiraceae bacterium]|nr:TIGR03936 family radical SAM-associated protein [Lachnospiraceae bacterium]